MARRMNSAFEAVFHDFGRIAAQNLDPCIVIQNGFVDGIEADVVLFSEVRAMARVECVDNFGKRSLLFLGTGIGSEPVDWRQGDGLFGLKAAILNALLLQAICCQLKHLICDAFALGRGAKWLNSVRCPREALISWVR